MARKEWVVRVSQSLTQLGEEVNEGGAINDSLLECLRYAQLIVVHDTDPEGLISRCFDLVCPKGLVSETWAKSNAERMQTFGFDAIAVPRLR